MQWTTASGGNGHWYKRFDTPVLWAEARDISASLGGYLATVPTAAENAFVALIDAGHNCWLGGFQAPDSCENNCDWQWVTGEPWNWTNWDWGQPDNAGEEDQLQYWAGSDRWNDHRADVRFGHIIEWSTGLPGESDCNANGIPDSCDVASGSSSDCNASGVPDSCESDTDADGTIDACDGCPNDPAKINAGACGCGVADTDTDSDGTANCFDDDDDNDGVADYADAFPLDASESVDTDGDGQGNNADQDDDGDGADDASDGCPFDTNKTAPGVCGCGSP
ncbi:MAG: hypothetical protein EBR07_09790, partial [Planctomycetes bacterium]|nr:hypothetical protein [Planctomycetota bacterium]